MLHRIIQRSVDPQPRHFSPRLGSRAVRGLLAAAPCPRLVTASSSYCPPLKLVLPQQPSPPAHPAAAMTNTDEGEALLKDEDAPAETAVSPGSVITDSSHLLGLGATTLAACSFGINSMLVKEIQMDVFAMMQLRFTLQWIINIVEAAGVPGPWRRPGLQGSI